MSRRHHDRPQHPQEPAPQQPPAQGQDGQVPTQAPSGEQADAAALRAERDDLLSRLQRVSADFLNYQKRIQRDIAEAREFANAELIQSLLVVLDDLERAIQAARANHSADDPLLVGTQLVYDKALATLAQFGVSAIPAAGERFDPYKHQALQHRPSEQHPAGVVLEELQKGYTLKGKTLRAASVVVSSGPPAESPRTGDDVSSGG